MNWNWESHRWKTSTKILLGIATIWPIIYMGVFILGVFSILLLIPSEDRSNRNTENIDLIQLERKIENGEVKQLTIKQSEIVALDRVSGREYHTQLTNTSTRNEILAQAQEHDANGQPRVAKIEEEADRPVPAALPVGFVALFGAHILTIFLIMGLMPLYIILAVKSSRLDETMRIIWVVLICMLGFFAMPVYWYLYIWREPPVSLPRSDVAQIPEESAS